MRKAQMAFLQNFIVGVVVAGVLLVIGAYVTASVQAQMSNTSAAYLVGGNVTVSLRDVGSWFPIIGIAGVAGVILSLILVYVAGRR